MLTFTLAGKCLVTNYPWDTPAGRLFMELLTDFHGPQAPPPKAVDIRSLLFL